MPAKKKKSVDFKQLFSTITNMSCENCDDFFQECIGEVDPDNPSGYAVCQALWDHCKAGCTGNSRFSRADTLALIEKQRSKVARRRRKNV